MSNIITLRSTYKTKEYHFQPCKQSNGMNFPFVKKVRIGAEGESEMILSEAERNNPEHAYFIPEDLDIVIREGTTFDLDDPLQKNMWLSIKDSVLIVPTRDSRDANGNLLIDGDKLRYGEAELWVDIPGEESEKSVAKKRLISRAYVYIEKDSVDGRLTRCKLLGKNMRNAPSSDVEDYLYQQAERNPQLVIDLYTNGDTALKLLLIDAKEKNVIRKVNGLFMFGETVLGSSDDAIILFFKTPANKSILDLIKKETYPDFMVDLSSDETTKKPKTTKKE